MSKKFYTADFHLFHYNIIKYCNRPFATLDEMHETIINGMNERVQKNDELYILGDVSFYCGRKVCAILDAIKCQRKHLIIGNHDAKNIGRAYAWESVSDYKIVFDHNVMVVLMHYPIESWKAMAHGSIHLHGHRHGNAGHHGTSQLKFRVDVGVDPMKFKPVCLEDLTKLWLEEGKLV
jgi:calcineurin-like phosphoesterase family protein